MMIVFQNKIVYMPSMPPFSRSERVEEYAKQCKPVSWVEVDVKSSDGTKLKLLEGTIFRQEAPRKTEKHIVVVYFQGNASSLPPRLPYLSSIMKILHAAEGDAHYTMIALSYRGYWKSGGRANQKGIELDAQAALEWVAHKYDHLTNMKVVLWGQSIGAGVATTSLETWLRKPASMSNKIAGLLLETPFTSLKAMLISLYPQKFLPYRYLGPFLWSTWDSEAALVKIAQILKERNNETASSKGIGQTPLHILLLEAGEDELVPKGDAVRLLEACRTGSTIEAKHKIVSSALHTNVMMKSEGKREIVSFLRNVSDTLS